MALYMEHIRGGDDVIYGGDFQPTQSQSQLILWECDTTGDDQSWTGPEYTTAAEVLKALSDNSLRFRAAVGLPFQEWDGSSWNPVTSGTEFGPMLVRSLTVEEHPNKANAWSIRLMESGMGNLTDDGTFDGPAQGAPAISVNVSARTRNMQAWRMGIQTIPTDVPHPSNEDYFDEEPWQLCDSTQDDCGGASIDYNGIPKVVKIEQNHITVEFIARSSYLQWDGSYQIDNEVAYYQNARALGNAVGNRNREPLFGYGVGFLMLTDVAIQPLHHEFKRVIVTFVADVYKHADQQPWQTDDGIVAKTEGCAASDELANMQASSVWWSQPFLQGFTFGANPEGYFPAGVWQALWWKMGVDPADYVEAGGTP